MGRGCKDWILATEDPARLDQGLNLQIHKFSEAAMVSHAR